MMNMTNEMTNDTRIIKTNETISSLVDDEYIVLVINESKYISLNKIGSRIWALLDEEISFNQLLDKLCAEYDVDIDSCRLETQEYLFTLLNNHMINLE